MARGRQSQEIKPMVFPLKLVLYPGADDDLIGYLQSAPPRLRSTMVKIAMRNGQKKAVVQPEVDDEMNFNGLFR